MRLYWHGHKYTLACNDLQPVAGWGSYIPVSRSCSPMDFALGGLDLHDDCEQTNSAGSSW